MLRADLKVGPYELLEQVGRWNTCLFSNKKTAGYIWFSGRPCELNCLIDREQPVNRPYLCYLPLDGGRSATVW
jgi:hypothetical protein